MVGIKSADGVPSDVDGTLFMVEAHCTKLLPGPQAQDGPVATAKVEQTAYSRTEAGNEARVLAQKLQICKDHRISDENIATLLGVEPETLMQMRRDNEIHQSGKQMLIWEEAFDWLVERPLEAVLTLTLKSYRNSPSAPKEKVLGTYRLNVADIRNDTTTLDAQLSGTEITLRIRVQLRYFDTFGAHRR
eukprot:gnl/TRDRNA2_/TRDRNA2_120076_c1_seq1.p1 gnl/TRDRNA2_/TRDRNA2_120076_c1~~gnl/TRDRNA2_/TRDRNA2_120076_c1_seq1.p1  ORF type:complete len:189 (+),score=20.94 gnl/TRDRNA2_/TRDRNA2_120076_c1_seq1:2-568(+)